MANSSISQFGGSLPLYKGIGLQPANSAQRSTVQFAASNPATVTQADQAARPYRLSLIMAMMMRYMQPDATMYRISELTPRRLKQLGDIKAVVFDLDDTLSRLFTGHLSEETLLSLHRLKIAGYQMGIVTNNIQPEYCRQIRKCLAEAGLEMPFIEDARKPSPFGFNAMRQHFDVTPSQTVVVGDGLISDIVCAKRLGMKAIRAHWHTKNYLLCREPFLSMWDSMAIFLNSMRVWLFTRRQPMLTGVNRSEE